MEYRTLGSSGLNVSVLSFGGWQLGDPQYWGAEDEAAEKNHEMAVRAAFDAGVNLFDTAEMYGNGNSECALGRALRGIRDQVLVASKVLPEHAAPEAVRKSCEASLRRLDTDWIDLYQMHWPSRNVPFADTYAAMDQLRQEGKIRHIGVSNFGVRDLDSWFRTGACVSNQLGYNLAFRAIEYAILPECMRRGIGVLVYMPLLQGILSGRWNSVDDMPQLRRRTRHFASGRPGVRHSESGCETLLMSLIENLCAIAREIGATPATTAVAWVMAQPGITSVILGARDTAQFKQNLAAVRLRLPSDVLTRLHSISAPIKSALGPNADMWLTESRIQ